MKKIIIIGGIGNGTVVLSTIEDINKANKEWDVLGFLNDNESGEINGYPVLGKINAQTVKPFLSDSDTYFYYSLISTKLNHKFIHRLHELNIPLDRFATIIHPTAVVSKFAEIGHGVSIQPFVSVGPNVKIGNHIQIYAQSLIGHNSCLHDYSYVANNACIGAGVILHEGAYLGTNCTTLEGVVLGQWSLAGVGSVVIRDIPEYAIVVGNPSKVIGSTK
jgi:acetyltransferase EpsM